MSSSTANATKTYATAVLKEVPLAHLGAFMGNMRADANGSGCGGGCGGGCRSAIDIAGHVLDPQLVQTATGDKAALTKEISAQATAHLQTFGQP